MVLNDDIKNFVDQSGRQETAQAAIDRFQWKPYVDVHAKLITLSKWAQKLLPVLSCVTGSLFLIEVLRVLPTWAALIIAIVVFSLWEIAKNNIVVSACDGKYSKRKDFWSMAAVALFLVAGSMFCSVSGAEVVFEQVDNRKAEIEQNYEVLNDSLSKFYKQQVVELKSEKSLFVGNNQIFINNKIGTKFNSKLSKQLQAYEARIDSARSEHKLEKKELKASKKTALHDAAKDSGFNAWVFIVLAFIIDLGIVVATWFPIHAQYQFAVEWQTLKGQGSQEISMDMESLSKLLAMANYPPLQTLAASSHASTQQSSQIGFKGALNHLHKGPASSFKVPLKDKQKKDSDYWVKYPKLCDDLQQKNAGTLEVTHPELADKHAVSVDTVYRVQKAVLA